MGNEEKYQKIHELRNKLEREYEFYKKIISVPAYADQWNRLKEHDSKVRELLIELIPLINEVSKIMPLSPEEEKVNWEEELNLFSLQANKIQDYFEEGKKRFERLNKMIQVLDSILSVLK